MAILSPPHAKRGGKQLENREIDLSQKINGKKCSSSLSVGKKRLLCPTIENEMIPPPPLSFFDFKDEGGEEPFFHQRARGRLLFSEKQEKIGKTVTVKQRKESCACAEAGGRDKRDNGEKNFPAAERKKKKKGK